MALSPMPEQLSCVGGVPIRNSRLPPRSESAIPRRTTEVASLEKSVSEFTSDIESEQTELDAVRRRG